MLLISDTPVNDFSNYSINERYIIFQLTVKDRVADFFHKAGGFGLLRNHIGKKNAFVLMYHRILESPENEVVFVQPGMYVKPETFKQHIAFLNKHFTTLPLSELVARIKAGKSVGQCCAITFDDGWRDNYTRAYPILREFEMPATIFLATGLISTNRLFWPEEFIYYLQKPDMRPVLKDKSPMLGKVLDDMHYSFNAPQILDACIAALKTLKTEERDDLLDHLRRTCPNFLSKRLLINWDEAREMKDSGLVCFGGHTANHLILDQIPYDQAEEEIVRACSDLEENIGLRPELFAYPNGNYTERIQALLKKHGIKGAMITRKGWVSTKSNLFEIPRIAMHEDVSCTLPLFMGRIFLKGF